MTSMVTNTKRNEHPGCGCRMCTRGKRRPAGHWLLNQVQKRIRRGYKNMLRNIGNDDAATIIISTPFTD